eukprot:3937416-Rhodomonas_salina.3
MIRACDRLATRGHDRERAKAKHPVALSRTDAHTRQRQRQQQQQQQQQQQEQHDFRKYNNRLSNQNDTQNKRRLSPPTRQSKQQRQTDLGRSAE